MAQKLNILKVLKIALGSILAIIIAEGLHLSYVTSAGVITLLSIHNTKRETVFALFNRGCAFLIALAASYVSFLLLGYHPWALGIFLVLFVGICHLCSFHDAIAMNVVLVTHFYVEQSMSWIWVRNEALLLLIGAGIGVLMNVYIPDNSAAIRRDQAEIEHAIKGILVRMASALLLESKTLYDENGFGPLEKMLGRASARAVANRDNTLLSDTRYFLKYMNMRTNQIHILKRIYQNICLLNKVPPQTYAVSEFIGQISDSFRESNNALSMLKRLEELKLEMKEETLPVTREEFENRAVLYRILYDLEDLLSVKRDFVERLEEREILKYWDGNGE